MTCRDPTSAILISVSAVLLFGEGARAWMWRRIALCSVFARVSLTPPTRSTCSDPPSHLCQVGPGHRRLVCSPGAKLMTYAAAHQHALGLLNSVVDIVPIRSVAANSFGSSSSFPSPSPIRSPRCSTLLWATSGRRRGDGPSSKPWWTCSLGNSTRKARRKERALLPSLPIWP